MKVEGTHVCDRCGVDVGAGDLFTCIVVSRLSNETGMVENLHFCLDRDQDGETVAGCGAKILQDENLADYLLRQEEARAALKEQEDDAEHQQDPAQP